MKGKVLEEAPVRRVALKNVPSDLIHYIWASEDQAFFEHQGFDLARVREAIAEAKDGEPRGVSTITMQCARSVFLWQGRSYLRKALEAYYTVWMELLMSKRRILELYLNHIELGPGIYGIGAAAHEYFGKAPDQLTRSEMIALAAILPNPLKWSPVRPNTDSSAQDPSRRAALFASAFSSRGTAGRITALACDWRARLVSRRRCPATFEETFNRCLNIIGAGRCKCAKNNPGSSSTRQATNSKISVDWMLG